MTETPPNESPLRTIITGGGSGIGAATARRIVDYGGRVAKLDLRPPGDEPASDNEFTIECDVRDPADVERAIDEAAGRLGGVDAVFANAGIAGVFAPLEQLTPEEWRATLAVNLDGVFYTMRAAVAHLRQRGGAIVATSSVAGVQTFGTGGAAAYMASKAGVVSLVKAAAAELGRFAVRVNAIMPGAVATRFLEHDFAARDLETLEIERLAGVPLAGPKTTPDDVAGLVAYLLSPAAGRITGAIIPIDGGQALLGGGKMRGPETSRGD